MKTILLCSILFCAIVLPALGELTEADLNKIRLIVKEEINTEIESFEKDMKEYINIKNESIEKRLTMITNLVYALIGCIGIPLIVLTVLIAWRSLRDNSREKQIGDTNPEIEITQAFTPTR